MKLWSIVRLSCRRTSFSSPIDSALSLGTPSNVVEVPVCDPGFLTAPLRRLCPPRCCGAEETQTVVDQKQQFTTVVMPARSSIVTELFCATDGLKGEILLPHVHQKNLILVYFPRGTRLSEQQSDQDYPG